MLIPVAPREGNARLGVFCWSGCERKHDTHPSLDQGKGNTVGFFCFLFFCFLEKTKLLLVLHFEISPRIHSRGTGWTISGQQFLDQIIIFSKRNSRG